ncbi:hypothetical protein TrRE_jg12689 [Triparma retinervis]|uniref:Uncharacterized protein n=1 Tax=Triparma retinervis TaxID=2557542 RepID=A0A9W6Z812_9STRA|nr:hypothetical protein TrRE_jg12689 [Triparma retinervis]
MIRGLLNDPPSVSLMLTGGYGVVDEKLSYVVTPNPSQVALKDPKYLKEFTKIQAEAAARSQTIRLAFHNVAGGYSRAVVEGVMDAIVEST